VPEQFHQNEIDNSYEFLPEGEVPKFAQDLGPIEDDGKSKMARNVWSIQRLTELPPSTKHNWRKIFRFTAEEFWGIFYADGTLVPGQPFFRRVYRGMRGMLSDQGRLMIACPNIPSRPPFKPGKILEFELNTVRAIINEFYKGKFTVKLKGKGSGRQDLWEYLGVNTPEVVKALSERPPKKYSPSKFRVKLTKKYYPKFRPAHVKRKKAERSVLSYDMLPPDSYRAKQIARRLEKKLQEGQSEQSNNNDGD
jgi:hypothetical protein